MKSVTLILPLEPTTWSDSRGNSRSDTVVTAGATSAAMELQKRWQSEHGGDNGATAEVIDSRSDSRSYSRSVDRLR